MTTCHIVTLNHLKCQEEYIHLACFILLCIGRKCAFLYFLLIINNNKPICHGQTRALITKKYSAYELYHFFAKYFVVI